MELSCYDCILNKLVLVSIKDHGIQTITETIEHLPHDLYIGPGLIDLQVNGFKGMDYNGPSLTTDDMVILSRELMKGGITTLFPTIITNSKEKIIQYLQRISRAYNSNSFLASHIGGIHLEGPFISPMDGAHGAHPTNYIIAPDWELFKRFQEAADGLITIVTLSPEWENSIPFIEKCIENNIMVSIGHSNATPSQLQRAVKSGASLSTHLGNGIPQMLHRTSNIIFEQLANDHLAVSIIADGFHAPSSFLKTVITMKNDQALLISDSTKFGGMSPGEYQTHIGDNVILDEMGKLYLKHQAGYLAGATFTLTEGITFLLQENLASLKQAWSMASINPLKQLRSHSGFQGQDPLDLVIFKVNEGRIKVKHVFKAGKEMVFPK